MRQHACRGRGVGSSIILFAALACEAAQGQPYAVTDLGDFGGAAAYVNDLNIQGNAVGYSAQNHGQAFIWECGEMSALPWLPIAWGAGANGINTYGDAVGYCSTYSGTRAVLWSGGNVFDLSGPMVAGQANKINDSGIIVGVFQALNDDPLAVVWAGSDMIVLPPLAGGGAGATDINLDGVIVGTSDTADPGAHACMWVDSVITDLGTLGGDISYASAINDAGQIVGQANTTTPPYNDHAVIWQDGAITDLGTLGGYSSAAFDINSAGDIVGFALTAQNAAHACLWRSGSITDLNDWLPPASGWILVSARAINDAGQIGGVGQRSGQSRAFLMTPPTCLLWVTGDTSCDGTVSFGDINPFVLALVVPEAYALLYPYCNWLCHCDVNRDGCVDFADINPFVALLTGS